MSATRPPCHIDVETRSVVDLKKAGVYAYALDPTTAVWCAAYAFGDGPVELWTLGEPCPPDIREHAEQGGEFCAWNASFERIIWKAILARRYGWPQIKTEQWRCIMAEAMAMALPASLEQACAALGLEERKDMAGHRVMMQLCRPRRMDGDKPVWWDDSTRLATLYAYNKQDVVSEREAEKRLVRLSPGERRLYHLDALINDRGVMIDTRLCHRAKKVVAEATDKLDKEMRHVTKGAVEKCSNAQQLLKFLRERGIDTEKVDKEALSNLLQDDHPEDVERAIQLRREAAKTSTAKIDAMLHRVNDDGRMRGNLKYHGANTGRWSAIGAQLQNLPRPTEKVTEQTIADLFEGNVAKIDMLYGAPLTVVSNCVRSMIVAGEGKELETGDFANIEGRELAWLADEQWKLNAFAAYDRKEGPDLYKVAAAGVFNCRIDDVKDSQRQVGKVTELALGYQGGVGAFAAMAKGYGVKMDPVYPILWPVATPDDQAEALEAHKQRGRHVKISKEAWLASELTKMYWRRKHPKTVALWKATEEAAVEAVERRGAVVSAGKVRYRMSGSFLWCQLPSGRVLCYPYPKLRDAKTPWGGTKTQLVYKYVDQFTRKWTEGPTYGGSLVENITQAVARDVMAEAMLRVERAGYPVVLTVHDEIVTEPACGVGNSEEFRNLMSTVPDWNRGCPIAVEGWRGRRYRK